MKENLDKSLNFCLKSRKAIETVIDIFDKTVDKHPDLSDEVQCLIETIWEVLEEMKVTIDEVIDTVNNRQQVFGKEGLEKKCWFERSEEDEGD